MAKNDKTAAEVVAEAKAAEENAAAEAAASEEQDAATEEPTPEEVAAAEAAAAQEAQERAAAEAAEVDKDFGTFTAMGEDPWRVVCQDGNGVRTEAAKAGQLGVLVRCPGYGMTFIPNGTLQESPDGSVRIA